MIACALAAPVEEESKDQEASAGTLGAYGQGLGYGGLGYGGLGYGGLGYGGLGYGGLGYGGIGYGLGGLGYGYGGYGLGLGYGGSYGVSKTVHSHGHGIGY